MFGFIKSVYYFCPTNVLQWQKQKTLVLDLTKNN